MILFVMNKFKEAYSSKQIQNIISIVKCKVSEALKERNNFLVYCRNPIKICLLLCEFIKALFNSKQHLSYLRPEASEVKGKLIELALEIMKLQRDENDMRSILTDTDLKEREVITIICEMEAVDLLSHPFIEKLAD